MKAAAKRKKAAPQKTAAKKTAAKQTAAKQTAKQARPRRAQAPAPWGPELHALRSCIYHVDDLARAKDFYRQVLGKEPYFDEPYYVGFDVDGSELGLDPDLSKRQPGAGGSVCYWRVGDINATWQHLTSLGGQSIELPHHVGVALQTSIVADPFGNLIGLIQG
jgi:predicted enzyme related to lactoylglutathione lyase